MADLKTYSISTDITAAAVHVPTLTREIDDSGHVTGFDGLDRDGDDLTVRGTSINDEPSLDTVVQNHGGLLVPSGIFNPFPTFTTTERDAFSTSDFEDGATIYNSTTNTVQYWNGSEWICPLDTAHFFEEGNSLATTINNTTDFEDLNISLGANSLNTLSGFSVSGNTITKTSTGTGLFSCTWSIDGESASGNNRNYRFKPFKNGTTNIDGQCESDCDDGSPHAATMTFLVSLTQNDTVDLKVRATSNSTNFEALNNTITIKRAD